MGIAEIGGFFAWDLGVVFLGIPNFKILRFQKKCFYKILILSFHRKMCRFFPCIYIFSFFFFFFIKSAKRMCICDYVENRVGAC